ncbi:MAG: hypothetical protein AAGD11_06515 [Planctomycetota bacterium]
MVRPHGCSALELLVFTGLMVAAAPSAALTTHFSDGSFSSGWDDLEVVFDDPTVGGTGPGTSNSAINRRSSGGNGGAYLESTHFIVYGDTVYSIGLNTTAVYNPVSMGEIGSIDYSVDLIHPSLGSTAWQLFIRQDDTYYYSVPITGFSQDSSWENFELEDLTEDDFDTNPLVGFGDEEADGNAPDFSIAGSPMTFGYALGNTRPQMGSFTNIPGLDNWDVTITAVSLPGDFDLDEDVDGHDFLEWQRSDGTAAGLAAWEMNYGTGVALQAISSVPEPSSVAMACLSVCLFSGRSWRLGS